jgi:hypothetical protein
VVGTNSLKAMRPSLWKADPMLISNLKPIDKYLHKPAIIKAIKEGGEKDGKSTQVDIGQT